MTKRKYRVFGFKSEVFLAKACPVFGTTVTASSPEDAVEYAIKNKRGAKNVEYWGVCSLSNFVEIAVGHSPYGRQVRVM